MIANKLHTVIQFISHFLGAKRKGHGVHSPFAYQLCEEVFYNTDEFYDFLRFEKRRKDLLLDETVMKVDDKGAGSRIFTSPQRKIKEIAKHGISPAKQSALLYRLINFLKVTTTIELGTSLGLNTLYLAAANPAGKVFTIEGSEELSGFAKKLSEKTQINNIEFICENFDTALPAILKKIETPGLVYIDGNHTYAATLKYFQICLDHIQPDTVLIFDDIYWSPGMTKAWKEICKNAKVRMSIDLFHLGLIFFREEIKEKVDLRLYVDLN